MADLHLVNPAANQATARDRVAAAYRNEVALVLVGSLLQTLVVQVAPPTVTVI
jgi:hypothetical protein